MAICYDILYAHTNSRICSGSPMRLCELLVHDHHEAIYEEPLNGASTSPAYEVHATRANGGSSRKANAADDDRAATREGAGRNRGRKCLAREIGVDTVGLVVVAVAWIGKVEGRV